MNHEKHIRCMEREEEIMLLACGEMEGEAAVELDAHLSECAGCAEAFEEQRHLHEAFLLNAGPEPSVALLAECRTQLDAAVDHASQPGFLTRVWAGFSKGGWAFGYRSWLSAHPVMGAAVFVLTGVVLGNVAPRWLQQSADPGGFQSGGEPTLVVSPTSGASPIAVRDISMAPTGVPGEGLIVVRGVRETPIVQRGTADDPAIRQFLIEIVPNGSGFNVDTRMMALDLLKTRGGTDTQVRDLLCQTARNDRDPAVRLKALEALRGLEQDDTVRKTLTQVLLSDSNAGVRIEAINSLRQFAENANASVDKQTVDVLRERMEKDPNTFIRVQSAAAMRQLAQRGVY